MSPAARRPGWAVITILKSRLRLVYLSQILHAQDGSNRGQHQQQCKAAVAGSNIRREGRQELQGQGYVARIQKHTAPHASQAPIRAGEGCGQGLVEDRSGCCCTTTCIDNESIRSRVRHGVGIQESIAMQQQARGWVAGRWSLIGRPRRF